MSTYQRIREKQISRRNRFFKKIIVTLLFCTALGGGYFLLRQPWLSFGIIYVLGNEELLREDVLFVGELKEPVNFFVLDKKKIQATLKNDLRIKDAYVSYEFPNILLIEIEEERPLFYLASSYGYVTVGSQKQVLSAAKSIKKADAPIISGLTGKNVFIGDIINDNKIIHIFEFLNLLDEQARQKISEINVYDDVYVRAIDLGGRPYILGDIRTVDEKSAVFSVLIKEFSEKNLDVELIDLSYSQPYIKIKQNN